MFVVRLVHIYFYSMDDVQKNHLKAYGITYWTLVREVEVKWLLNYRGGSFIMEYHSEIENECKIREISYQVIADVQAMTIFSELESNESNTSAIKISESSQNCGLFAQKQTSLG